MSANNLGYIKQGGPAIQSQEISHLEIGDGVVGGPALAFKEDVDSGIYRIGANNIGVAVNGAKVLDISTSGLSVTGVTSLGDGAVGAPGLAFSSDSDSGVYRIGANNIGVAVAGAKVLDVSTSGLGVTGVTSIGNGTVSLPGLAFSSDPDSGLYRVGANDVAVGAGGVIGVEVKNASGIVSVVCGSQAALAQGATDGFLYIPAISAAPNGTPSAFTGKIAIAYCTADNKIYAYNGGWLATSALA